MALLGLPALATAATLTTITTPSAAYAGSQWATLASKHGFIVIYPGSPNAADQCWDVSSKETLTHDGGGDSLGIVSMVRWTLDKYKGDKTRVFVTGVSSGGMMTQVLIGAYPDVFAAGSAFAGVPFGCFAPAGDNSGQYDYWNGDCATGKVTHTAEEWGDIVRAAYPGYEGWRPKLQIFHGTNDEVLSYVNHGEAIKEWTDVMGLSETPTSVVQNTPLSGWTKSVYGPSGWLEAYSAAGVTHNIQNQEYTALALFQLNQTSGYFSWGQGSPCSAEPSASSTSTVKPSSSSTTVKPSSTSTSSTIKTTSSAKPTTTAVSSTTSTSKAATSTTSKAACPTNPGGAALWSQCGGMGYTGPTTCANGVCTKYNDWYSQCTPVSGC
ncbi:hypothetical protein NEMBOFW57_009591 [Staphylotrichum longicolle]|uniref:CBM1 domain-containing protein n=1 Tax=Staphylotrichum longicolle TaxID=669026 RepID=A0AAD4HXW5_9PEZI|nr:hypothetical protein NEMBOFW57_009591 [Staphylotrichum longicolle]